jgi:hypothetical protein
MEAELDRLARILAKSDPELGIREWRLLREGREKAAARRSQKE